MSHSLHPQVLSSLIIIRSKAEFVPGSAISSLALFTVSRSGQREARFELTHHLFDRDTPRADILDTLCRSLPAGGELLMRAPIGDRQPTGSGPPPPPSDLDLIRRNRPELTILPLTLTDSQLVTAGAQIGIDVPSIYGTPLRRRRRAPYQAMALWQAYTARFCRGPEARVLFAAFQAWRALQEARPIPF
jgi:hypothetical protein